MTAPPAVQHAIAAMQLQLELVRLDFPDLPPRQQEQLARSRCIEEIAAANLAIDMAARRPPAGPQQALRHRRG